MRPTGRSFILAGAAIQLAVAPLGCSSNTSHSAARPRIQVLVRQGGQILLPVDIPNAGQARFILDTGSSANILSELARSRLIAQSRVPRWTRLSRASFIQTMWPLYTVPMLCFGHQYLRDVPFTVVPSDRIHRLGIPELDGILGIPFISHYGLEVDYRTNTVSFWDPDELTEHTIREMGFSASQETVLDEFADHRLAIECQIGNGSKHLLMVDTGSTWTVVPKAWLGPMHARPYATVDGVSLFHTYRESLVEVSKLRVGPYGLRDVGVAVVTGRGETHRPVLGWNVLCSFHFLLIPSRRTIYLSPASEVTGPSLHSPRG